MGLLIWKRRRIEIKRKKAPLIVQRDNLVVSLTIEAPPLKQLPFHGQFHIYGRCACEQVSNWNLQAAVTLAAIIVRILVLYFQGFFPPVLQKLWNLTLLQCFSISCKCFFWEQLSWSYAERSDFSAVACFLNYGRLRTNSECYSVALLTTIRPRKATA